MTNPVASAPIDAYGGWVSDNRINEGDEVLFGGTFYNFQGTTVFIYTMNVTFTEILGIGANREPNRPNISKVYETTQRSVISNGSLTDTMVEEIKIEPGAYNVSIFFEYSNSSSISPTTALGTVYALVNSSFIVEGLSETLEFFRIIGILIGIAAIAVFGIIVYNSKFKK